MAQILPWVFPRLAMEILTMKLVQQLRFSVVLLVMFAIFNLGLVYDQIDQMTTDGRVVNFAGIVRGATQRATKLELVEQPHLQVVNQLDEIIQGLIFGNEKLGLPAVQDPEFEQEMKRVKMAWSSLAEKLKQRQLTQAEKEVLLRESEEYWDLTNRAVFAAEEFAARQVYRLKVKQVFLFIVNLMLLGFIGWKLTGNISLQLLKAIQNLGVSATELASTVAEQERAAEQQTTAMNETTLTLDKIGHAASDTAQETQQALQEAKQALRSTNQGSTSATRMLIEMENLNKTMMNLQEKIDILSQQVTQINHISDLVGDLATQTNMLALNASVEAARTGTEGKGFTVVAGEIRKLADRSKKSAREINQLIGEVLLAINAAVMLTETGSHLVEFNLKLTEETVAGLGEVKSAIDQMLLNNQEIFQNSQDQNQALHQVMQQMADSQQASSEMALGISHIKLGAQNLQDAVLHLKMIV